MVSKGCLNLFFHLTQEPISLPEKGNFGMFTVLAETEAALVIATDIDR
jgi:hypothetical protein